MIIFDFLAKWSSPIQFSCNCPPKVQTSYSSKNTFMFQDFSGTSTACILTPISPSMEIEIIVSKIYNNLKFICQCFLPFFRLLERPTSAIYFAAERAIRRLPVRLVQRAHFFGAQLYEGKNGRQYRLHLVDGVSNFLGTFGSPQNASQMSHVYIEIEIKKRKTFKGCYVF